METEKGLLQWVLFNYCREFNLYFGIVVSRFKQLLIELVCSYYAFDIDLEVNEAKAVLNEDH